MELSTICEIIENIELISETDETAYEKIITELAKIEKFPVLLYEHKAGIELFRSRTFSEKILIEEINDIGPTPSKYINSFGRCNRPKQSRFYLSENRPTSFIELVESWSHNKSVNDKVHVLVGRWQILSPLKSIIITSPNKVDRKSVYDIQNGIFLDQFIENTSSEDREATKRLYEYFFDKFRKNSKEDLKNYLITSAITNFSFSVAKNHSDSIQYPSVPFGGDGDNFAINEDFCNNKNLKLLDVLYCELLIQSQNENGTYNFIESYQQQSVSIDNDIQKINW